MKIVIESLGIVPGEIKRSELVGVGSVIHARSGTSPILWSPIPTSAELFKSNSG